MPANRSVIKPNVPESLSDTSMMDLVEIMRATEWSKDLDDRRMRIYREVISRYPDLDEPHPAEVLIEGKLDTLFFGDHWCVSGEEYQLAGEWLTEHSRQPHTEFNVLEKGKGKSCDVE